MSEQTSTETTPAQDNTGTVEGQQAQVQGQGETVTTETPAKTGGEGEGQQDQKPAEGEKKAAKIDLKYPDGFKADKLTEWFQQSAEGANLSSEQAQAVFDGWVALQAEAQGETVKRQEEAVRLLQAEWQKDFDANLKLAARTVQNVGGQELVDLLNKTGLGDNPAMVRTFHRIGKMLSEDSFVASGSGGARGVKRDATGLPMLKFTSMD